MQLAPSYSYTIAQVLDGPGRGLHIKLFHTETLAEKNFFMADTSICLESVSRHMESLTEEQCGQFINVKTPKKKNKKVDAEQ